MFKGPNIVSLAAKYPNVADWAQPFKNIYEICFSKLNISMYSHIQLAKYELEKVSRSAFPSYNLKVHENIQETGFGIWYEDKIDIPNTQTFMNILYSFTISDEQHYLSCRDKAQTFRQVTYFIRIERIVSLGAVEKIEPKPLTITLFDQGLMFTNENYRYYLDKYLNQKTSIKSGFDYTYSITPIQLIWDL